MKKTADNLDNRSWLTCQFLGIDRYLKSSLFFIARSCCCSKKKRIKKEPFHRSVIFKRPMLIMELYINVWLETNQLGRTARSGKTMTQKSVSMIGRRWTSRMMMMYTVSPWNAHAAPWFVLTREKRIVTNNGFLYFWNDEIILGRSFKNPTTHWFDRLYIYIHVFIVSNISLSFSKLLISKRSQRGLVLTTWYIFTDH